MESHKFSSWLIWRFHSAFFPVKPSPLLARKYFQWCIIWTPASRVRRQIFLKKRKGHVGFEDMKENFCQVVLSQRFWFLPHFGGTFHRFPNLTDIFKRLESWNQRISRPANGGCSNGASGRDKCVKLFVCCEATNAALNQRLEEAGGGGNYNIVDIPFRYMLCYIMLHARYQHSEIMRKNQPQKIPRCKTPFFFHFSLTMHGMHICRWCWFTTGLEKQRRTRGHRSRDVEWGNWLEFNKNGMLWHAYFIFCIWTGFF